jgi:sigma-B regulation protein RsbU (phosphoserine phosphatase)
MQHRILVVDDEREIVSLIRRSLELEHYQVVEAGDGEQALRALQAEIPDLILLDINLPLLDGFTVCRRIRAQGLGVPVIMLTGQTQVDARVRGLDCGADDYVGKPFDIPELLARVRAQLRRVESARSSAQELIRRKWEEINEGLMLAQRIQQPFKLGEQFEGLSTSVRYVPVGRIGGDFYHVKRLDNGCTAFLIGDAVGKGIGASLLMASTFSLLVRLLAEEPLPTRVFSRANAQLRQDFSDLGIFVAAFLGLWNAADGVLTWCNAGHQAPVVFRRGQGRRDPRSHEMLESSGLFLGAFDDGQYELRQTRLDVGDRLWMYTDGLADLRDEHGHVVDMRRIYRRMLRSWNGPVDRLMAQMLDSFGELARGGVTMRDDLTAILVEIEQAPASQARIAATARMSLDPAGC